MRPETRQTCLILGTDPQGENLHFIRSLSRDSGRMMFLSRRSRRKAAFDLFQTVVVRLRHSGSGPPFLEDTEMLTARHAIGKSYSKLKAASRFADLLIRNSEHLEDPGPVFQTATTVLDAIADSGLPSVCLFKGIFQLARVEGYPAREDWLSHLPPTEFETARAILFQPLDSLDRTATPAAESLVQSLVHWLEKTGDWRTGPQAGGKYK